MKSNYGLLWAFLMFPIGLAGCGYENRAFTAEQAVLGNVSGTDVDHSFTLDKTAYDPATEVQSVTVLLDKPTNRTGYYALQLSDAYKRLGDEAAGDRDFAAAGIIAVASGAALANASSVSGKDLAIILAGGALINEGSKWINSGGASEQFYKASETMACASRAIIEHFPTGTSKEANSVALLYIRRIELILRTGLKRDLPDWLVLLGAGNVPLPGQPRSFVTTPTDIQRMETSLKACLPKPENGQEPPAS